MKTIRSKTIKPLRVPLPQGKTLHLGPHQKGQIADNAVDHPPLRRLVDAGEVEIVGEGDVPVASPGDGGGVHEATHGHQPETGSHQRGNR